VPFDQIAVAKARWAAFRSDVIFTVRIGLDFFSQAELRIDMDQPAAAPAALW
jgi:hypothetical protein